MEPSANRTPLITILGLYGILTATYSLCVPLWEAPDEPSHYLCVRRLADGPRFIYPDIPGPAGQPWTKRYFFSLYERAQPPLAYWMTAPALKILSVRALPIGAALTYPDVQPDFSRQANVFIHRRTSVWKMQSDEVRGHLFRLLYLLPGCLAVGLVYSMARRLFTVEPAVAILAGGFTAVLPQFNFVTGTINNDAFAVLAATATLFCLLRLARARVWPTPVDYGLLGLLLVVALLTKFNLLFLYPLAGVVVLMKARDTRSAHHGLSAALATLLPTAGLVGAAYAFWPSAASACFHMNLARLQLIAPHSLDPGQLGERMLNLYQSFWATFGWMRIRVGPWLYWVWGILAAAGVAGWCCRRAENEKPQARDDERRLALLLALAFVLLLAAVIKNMLAVHQAQGRFLFPAIAPVAILVAAGLLRHVPARRQTGTAWGAILAMLVLNLVCFFGYLLPASYPGL